jgi:hypothetical protein
MKKIVFLVTLMISIEMSFAQNSNDHGSKIDLRKFYAYCLDGDIIPALQVLDTCNTESLSEKDKKLKIDFEKRFKGKEDQSEFAGVKNSSISALFKIYRDYWRLSLLDNSRSYDSLLTENIISFLKNNFQPARELQSNMDSIDVYLNKYIQSKHLHTTGFGKTGRLYDLLVWETENDTTYNFSLSKEQISARVILMNNFITLGWEEYATIGKYYPAGWSTREALYCVQKAYDMNSEDFLVSYLAHEGRHFSDFKHFPKLTSADLEYRAKLTELSMAEKTIYQLIALFINNANYESENGHSVANYCVIRDLSKALFKTGPEINIDNWKKISTKEINSAALTLLRENTKALKKEGRDVEKYIKK